MASVEASFVARVWTAASAPGPPAHFELAHVADVEESDGRSHTAVLLDDARVLHGHVPTAEGNHLGAEGGVDIAQGRALERSRGVRHGSLIILVDGHRACNENCAPARI